MGSGLSNLQLRCDVLEDLGQVLVCLHFVIEPADGAEDDDIVQVYCTAEMEIGKTRPHSSQTPFIAVNLCLGLQ